VTAAICAAVFGGVLASGGMATAQEPSPAGARGVLVQATTCNELPWSVNAWLELLRVELASDGIRVSSADASPPSESSVVAVEPASCDQAAQTAALTFVSGNVRLTRTLDLADVEPIARPRVVAIALADLIRSGIATQAPTPPAARTQPLHLDVHIQLEATPPKELSAPAPSRSLALLAAGETKLFARGNTGLFGARAGAELQPLREAALLIDAGALAGSARDPLGEISETVATLGVSLLGTGRTHAVSFGVGPRVEAGLGWVRGHASGPQASASSATSPLVLFAVSAIASLPIRAPLSAFLSLDAGTSLYGFSARANQRVVSDLGGPMLSVRVGFLWSPVSR
jgi:hypothetical protein